MEAKYTAIRKTPCSGPLPDLEIPMINTMVACLGVEHRKWNGLNMQLAYGATRLPTITPTEANPGSCGCGTRSGRIYGHTCRSKTGWSPGAKRITRLRAHYSRSEQRQEMRMLIATLHERSLGVDHRLTAGDRSAFGANAVGPDA
jgi:hypothetical protein